MYDSSVISGAATSTQMPGTPVDNGVVADQPPSQQVELPPVWAPKNMANTQGASISAWIMTGLQALSRIKWEIAVLAIFGILLIWASLIYTGSSQLAITLALAGVSIILISILYFFVTPSRLITSEICDMMSISNAELLSTLLEPLVGDAKGVYIPSNLVGTTQVMIMTKDSEFSKAFFDRAASITGINSADKNCLFITPPGYGLYSYIQKLGASFTREGLEDQIKDVLVSGLELAPSVEVSCSPNSVRVRVNDLSDTPMCKAMRQKCMRTCEQIGCPICSFISCMVVEGTGMRAMVRDISCDNSAIVLLYTLL